jgi:large conductance mechanosensitive channel
MIKGFKDFLLRGNVVDLAVGVVIGLAFGKVVSVFAEDFIGGLIGAVGGTPNFGRAGFTLNSSKVVIGTTINAIIGFLIVAAVVYFAVVLPVNRLTERRRAGTEPEAQAPSEEILLLQQIRDALVLQAQPSPGGAHRGPGAEPGTVAQDPAGGGPTRG